MALDAARKAMLSSAAKSAVAKGPFEEMDEGVEIEGDRATINLGNVPPFSIPKETAVKFALLILKKAGYEIDFGVN